jgi:hypothetical protein
LDPVYQAPEPWEERKNYAQLPSRFPETIFKGKREGKALGKEKREKKHPELPFPWPAAIRACVLPAA